MQLSYGFRRFTLFILAVSSLAMTTPVTAPGGEDAATLSEPGTYLISHEQMMHWLATTDAELTFDGEPINPLTARSALNTMVTYCNTRQKNVCGGRCTVYNGGAKCLNAPGTNCLAATHNVAFCNKSGCSGDCNQLSSCGTRLDDGFCYTPGTESILVSAA